MTSLVHVNWSDRRQVIEYAWRKPGMWIVFLNTRTRTYDFCAKDLFDPEDSTRRFEWDKETALEIDAENYFSDDVMGDAVDPNTVNQSSPPPPSIIQKKKPSHRVVSSSNTTSDDRNYLTGVAGCTHDWSKIGSTNNYECTKCGATVEIVP